MLPSPSPWIRKVVETMPTSAMCQQCGGCCRKFPYVELSQEDMERLQGHTGLDSEAFTNGNGKAVEEYFLKFQANGDCVFLKNEGGHYACSVYEARPDLCRSYPSSAVQIKFCDATWLKELNGDQTDP